MPPGRCACCHLQGWRCVCATIRPMTLATRLCLVIHNHELRRTTNTGQMALHALTNSEMRVRGRQGRPLVMRDVLAGPYTPLLLYPAGDAVELNRELVSRLTAPFLLIVPDGNWRQAAKVHIRQSELQTVTRVKFSQANTDSFRLRSQHRPEGMATLQAIAHAMGVLEGETVKNQLLRLYNARLEQARIGRGLLPATPAATGKMRQPR